MLAYMEALRGPDSYGVQVASKPVLVKGNRVWYEDPGAPGGVNFFFPADHGISVEWNVSIYGLVHNVLAATEAWGAGAAEDPACEDCHSTDGSSPVFDRQIMVDPWGVDGQPVYKTVREMTGLNPH